MKSLIIAFFCTLSLNAQNIKSEGTHFIDGVKDKKWSNSNGNNFTNASFSDFSGSCYVNIEVDKTTEVSFQTLTILSKGKLELKLIDEQENNYFLCKTSKVCEVQKDIILEKGKKYRLYFTGENAKGKYNVEWNIKNL